MTLSNLGLKPWYNTTLEAYQDAGSTNVYAPSLLSSASAAHVLGQKQYELSSHLGNVQATVSDKRYVQKQYLSTTDSLRKGFAVSVRSLYDYYPFGMPMKERSTSDTTTQSVYMSQVVYSPQYTKVNNAMSGASIMSLNTTASTNYNGSVNYTGQSASISKVLSSLLPNVPVQMKIDLLYTNKPLYLAIQQGSAASLSVYTNLLYSTTMNSSGTYTISFTPTQSSVQLSIAYSSFNMNANTLCFTLDSVNYQQQSASVSSTQLVQVSNKINDGYRFGYNGQEKVDEIAGGGNDIDFGARMYDSRLGRFFSIDPRTKEYPFWSPYSFAGNNPIRFTDVDGEGPGDPMHHQFLTTVAIDVYDAAKAKGASTKGALLVLAQASLESGWGQSAIKYKDFNLFGVMGSPSKRKTSHGSVKDYSNSGGYSGALTDYFNKIDKTWPDYKGVIAKENFTSADIDEALNTGSSYPTDVERMKGNYAYNADLDAEGKNHYGTALFKQMDVVKTRLIKSIDYQIEQNNNQIKQINSNLSKVGILTEPGRAALTKQKETLTNQNAKLTTVKTEINAVK